MKSVAFEELDIAIGLESGAWHDPNREHAWEIIEKFSEDAWNDLMQVVIGKPAYWQERCADAVGGVHGADSQRVLQVLLLQGSVRAAALAANALADDEVRLPHEYETRLHELRSILGPSSPILPDVDKLLNLMATQT